MKFSYANQHECFLELCIMLTSKTYELCLTICTNGITETTENLVKPLTDHTYSHWYEGRFTLELRGREQKHSSIRTG